MPNFSHRILTIIDQLILSAMGFATSAAIVKLGDIEQLGIYGAFLAVVTLVHSSYSSVVSGQMLLLISGETVRLKDSYFRLTEIIWLIYAFAAIIATLLLSLLASYIADGAQSKTVFSAGLCAIAISIFEQHRKLLYVKKHFLLSTTLTCVFIFVHVLISYYLITKNSHYYSATNAFTSLAIAYVIASALNPVFINAIKNAKKVKPIKAWALHKTYLKQGKFAFGGLSLAWLQNQSISVYILVIFGPTVAGLFNLGRLVTMPIMVVNTGLINGVLPTLRIFGVERKLIELKESTKNYAVISLILNLVYVVVVIIAFRVDWIMNLQEDLTAASSYVYFWLILTTGIVWRTWVTQFLIANLKFKILLKFNAISAFVTFSGFILLTLLGSSPLLIACVMLVGELVNYVLVKTEQDRLLKKEVNNG